MNISISSISEKDLDLALMNIILTYPNFTTWLANHLGLKFEKIELLELHRGVTSSAGESDLQILFSAKEQKFLFLIENKIKAHFTSGQKDGSYDKMMKQNLRQERADKIFSILICPSNYHSLINGRNLFNKVIFVKEIEEWIVKNAKTDLFSKTVIKRIYEKGIKNFDKADKEIVTGFWLKYKEYCNSFYPDLRLAYKGNDHSGRSGFIPFYFDPIDSSNRTVKILHKLQQGRIEIELSGQGEKEKLKKLQELFPEYIVRKAGKSAAIGKEVRSIQTYEDFNSVEEEISIILNIAKKMMKEYYSVKEQLIENNLIKLK